MEADCRYGGWMQFVEVMLSSAVFTTEWMRKMMSPFMLH